MLSTQPISFFQDKVVLVTGAAGSIGKELCRKVLKHQPKKVIALDQNESELFELAEEMAVEPVIADIRDKETIEQIFEEYRPQFVLHAAAYKHVPLMEKYPKEAVKTNILGTFNLIELAKKYKAEKFVFISTDKATYPESVMGLTKKIGELVAQQAGFIVVRFANVLASRGSVIPLWMKQIEEGRPLTITHPDMKRYFMTIEKACALVLEATRLGKGGEIFVLDMGNPLRIEDIANMIIKQTGKEVPIEIIGVRPGEKFEEELMTKEERERAEKVGDLFIIRNGK